MKVSVYAVGTAGFWEIWISLYPAVDRLWWSGGGGKGWNSIPADKLVVLSASLPLSWAVKLREQFRFNKRMWQWSPEGWAAYLNDSLQAEMQREEESGGRQQRAWINDVEIITEPLKKREQQNWWASVDSGRDNSKLELYVSSENELQECRDSLGIAADRLVVALSGRSLLQPEVEALLAEQLAGMERDWRSAAQLAYLQGRLKLEAAVSAGVEGEGEERSNSGCRRAEGKRGKCSNSSCKRAEGEREDRGNCSCRKAEGERGNRSNSSYWKAECSRTCRSRAGLTAALRLPLLLWSRGVVRRRAVERCLRCGSVATGRTPCAACGLAGCA